MIQILEYTLLQRFKTNNIEDMQQAEILTRKWNI